MRTDGTRRDLRFVAATLLAGALGLALGACPSPAQSAPGDMPVIPRGLFPNVCEGDDPLSHCDKSDPVACRRDSDCPAPNCGPCGSGDIVTHRDLGLDCVVAMCRGDGGEPPAMVCSPDHVCRIR
jgi:hypothetical protein